ncbi:MULTISPECIES: RidA family protein [Paraburkholderia]|uniref:RidA family protein n=1 Tax=Paraburkholderia TaxID=1822464 RepID=UPI0022511F56|nr:MULTISPECIES: RidA family protein [Paraburkholderia]MCX4162574.1 RidA family protein [Paraburkholderia megapolitana]MDN7158069.1 RidA family protein [Paraburkholderia sp. CHISQ3]MDQ6495116.1 RidA family protein [Paraburkholderia megapolitana]
MLNIMRSKSLSRIALTLALGTALVALPPLAYSKQRVELTDYQKQWGFSPLVVTKGGEIIWLGGHTTTTDDNGKDISYDFKAQVRQIFKNIDADLQRVGGNVSDLVSITVYVNDPRMNQTEAEVIKEVFKDGPYPGSALLTISNFARPGIVVEVQGIAVIKDELNRPPAKLPAQQKSE